MKYLLLMDYRSVEFSNWIALVLAVLIDALWIFGLATVLILLTINYCLVEFLFKILSIKRLFKNSIVDVFYSSIDKSVLIFQTPKLKYLCFKSLTIFIHWSNSTWIKNPNLLYQWSTDGLPSKYFFGSVNLILWLLSIWWRFIFDHLFLMLSSFNLYSFNQ